VIFAGEMAMYFDDHFRLNVGLAEMLKGWGDHGCGAGWIGSTEVVK
jgi:hypothetical protein